MVPHLNAAKSYMQFGDFAEMPFCVQISVCFLLILEVLFLS